ncbi:hypothetical protein D3C71_2075540 [compost metagenome]
MAQLFVAVGADHLRGDALAAVFGEPAGIDALDVVADTLSTAQGRNDLLPHNARGFAVSGAAEIDLNRHRLSPRPEGDE